MRTAIYVRPNLLPEVSRLLEDSDFIQSVELDMESVERRDTVSEDLAYNNVQVVSLNNVLPAASARHFFSATAKLQDEMIDYIEQSILLSQPLGVEFLNLELGLNQTTHIFSDEEVDEVSSILKKLILRTSKYNVELCLQLDYPGIPNHPGWNNTTQILNQLTDPAYRIVLNVYLPEVSEELELEQVIRDCHRSISVIRFNYLPSDGLYPSSEVVSRWFETLRRLSFKGVVVFNPLCRLVDNLVDEIYHVNTLAELMTEEEHVDSKAEWVETIDGLENVHG